MKPLQPSCCLALCLLAFPAFAQMTPTQRTTSDGRPLASSLPAKGGASRTQPRPLAFEELAQHLGDRVILTTIYGARIEGRVDSVSGSNLRLRVSAGRGYAITNFDRVKVRSISDVQ